MNIVFFGLSLSSSWGNGHATTYRALLRALAERGHAVTFLERDQPWYAEHRDCEAPPYCRLSFYDDFRDARRQFGKTVSAADAIVIGSYVDDAVELINWVTQSCGASTAFYDIDTPVTLAGLREGTCRYLSAEAIPRLDHYLSFSGGPILKEIRETFGARAVHPFFCSVDADLYFPEQAALRWDLGYLGTFAKDRERSIEELLLKPAREVPLRAFALAGPGFAGPLSANVETIDHLPPGRHRWYYNSQRYTLNVTRREMIRAGYSPSVRLFEAAACGTPVISDLWAGLEDFFRPGEEIFTATSAEDVVSILRDTSEEERVRIGHNARRRILRAHTSRHRARELESLFAATAAQPLGATEPNVLTL